MLEQLKTQMQEQLPMMRAEYEKLGALIAAAEAFVGDVDEVDIDSTTGRPQLPKGAPTGRQKPIRSDEFFGMNTHEAVKAFLAHSGKGNPQSPRAIAKALVDGGQSSDIKAVSVNVSSALKRM